MVKRARERERKEKRERKKGRDYRIRIVQYTPRKQKNRIEKRDK